MIFAAAAIAVAWSALLGAAYLTRFRLRLGRGSSLTVLAAIYAALGGTAFRILGGAWQGWAGMAGMLVPFAVACLLVGRSYRGRTPAG